MRAGLPLSGGFLTSDSSLYRWDGGVKNTHAERNYLSRSFINVVDGSRPFDFSLRVLCVPHKLAH
jgi:hypothetical protein